MPLRVRWEEEQEYDEKEERGGGEVARQNVGVFSVFVCERYTCISWGMKLCIAKDKTDNSKEKCGTFRVWKHWNTVESAHDTRAPEPLSHLLYVRRLYACNIATHAR